MKAPMLRNALLIVAGLFLAAAQTSEPADKPDASADAVAELEPIIAACQSGLHTGNNPPRSEGWGPRLHMSGTPRGIEALRGKDPNGMLASIRHTRELFERKERPGHLTIYYEGGRYVACEASIAAEPGTFTAIKAELLSKLHLNPPGALKANFGNLKYQYLLDDVTEAFPKAEFALAFHAGKSGGKDMFSVFLVKD